MWKNGRWKIRSSLQYILANGCNGFFLIYLNVSGSYTRFTIFVVNGQMYRNCSLFFNWRRSNIIFWGELCNIKIFAMPNELAKFGEFSWKHFRTCKVWFIVQNFYKSKRDLAAFTARALTRAANSYEGPLQPGPTLLCWHIGVPAHWNWHFLKMA